MKSHQKNSKKDFSAFNLSSGLISAVENAGYTQPTPIQVEAIPAVLEGQDLLASAETGSGKTAAFVLPLLQKIVEQRKSDGWASAKGAHVRALILVPTRELVVQIRDEVKKLAQGITPEVRCMSVYGGIKLDSQKIAVGSGVDVLIATPNRLLELTDKLAFNKLHTLVLDEADRLVDTHFKQEVEAVFKILPNKRQNLLFTATFPESIRELVRQTLDQPKIINLEHQTELVIDQHVVTVNFDRKHALLAHLLKENDWQQVLIFCSAKKTCDRVAEKLVAQKIDAVVLHGDKAQKERIEALSFFKTGKIRVLIATDVASRGIDVESLDCVINFELPRSPNDYVHRIGRTGRAGKTGQVISLISHHEYAHFSVIEKRNDLRLEREQIEGFEASAVAPPPPARSKPKKQAKKKLSKKQRLKLQKKQELAVKPYDMRNRNAASNRSTTNNKTVEPTENKAAWKKKEPVDKPWSQAKPDKQLKKQGSKSARTPLKKVEADIVPKSKSTATNKAVDKELKKSNDNAQVNEHIWGKRDS